MGLSVGFLMGSLLACSETHSGGRTPEGGMDASLDAGGSDGRADAGLDAGPADGGGDDAFDAPCAEPSDCTLAANTCCGVCGRPSLGDMDAIAAAKEEAHRRAVCPDPDPICPGCAAMPNPNLGATCDREEGRCTAFDIEQHEVSACTRDEDCIVRVPDCCACGADTSAFNLVALRADRVADYLAMVCDTGMTCLECEPVYPPNVEAFCDRASGHCRLRRAAP